MHESSVIAIVCVFLRWLIVIGLHVGLIKTRTSGATASQLIVTQNASILGTSEIRNLRVLYRLYGPESREFVFVSGTNHVYQFDAHDLQLLTFRVIGPQNFSVLCSDERECSHCQITSDNSWPKGYSPEHCGPRLTDNFVKAWATSTVSEDDVILHSDSLASPGNNVVINDDRIACEDALYLCYNVHHGYCERVKLQNVSIDAPWINPFEPIKKTPSRDSVVGCDPIMHATIVVGAQYVYAATEPDISNRISLFTLDPLSARFRDFQFANPTSESKTFVKLTDDSFIPLQYKLSFRYRTHPLVPSTDPTFQVPTHVYFVLQQPDSSRFTRWQPRVARICEGDKHFYSYVELNLACYDCAPPSDRKQKTLNALHTASRGQVGRILARQLKLRTASLLRRLTERLPDGLSNSRAAATTPGWDDFHEVLAVAFAAQPVDPSVYWESFIRKHGHMLHYVRSSFFPDEGIGENGAILLAGSALSLFSMAHIDAQFTNVVRSCLEGHGTRGPSHFLSWNNREYMGCVQESYLAEEPHYCPSKAPMNRFIVGQTKEDRLEAPSFLYLPKNVTGLATTVVSVDFTVCLVTTDDGWLFKYEVTSMNESRQLDAKLLAPIGTPLTGISLDITGTVAFVTSLDKVFRVELSNCGAYHTCKACLEAQDPYCGWCISEGRCSRMDQCQVPQTDHFDKHRTKRRPARQRERIRSKQTDYCSNKLIPGYARQPPIKSWLPYTSTVSMCPTIREIFPSGVQQLRSTNQSSESHSQSDPRDSDHTPPIVFHPDDTLANDPRFRMLAFNQSGHWQFGMPVPYSRRLVCAFRSAPATWLQSHPLLSGAWLPAERAHGLLVGIQPGSVFAISSAQLIVNSTGSLEVHCQPPPIRKLPILSVNQASLPLILWLDWFTPSRNSRNNDLVSDTFASLAPGLFAVYDCAQLTDCRSCTQSRFRCAWCLLEDRCVPSPPDPKAEEHLCTEMRQSGLTAHDPYAVGADGAGPLVVKPGYVNKCPRFTNDGRSITLRSGTPLVVTLRVYNVKRLLQHFTCVEGCSGQRVFASYDSKKSVVVCRNLTINITKHFSALQRRITDFHSGEKWIQNTSPGINCSLDLYWHGHDSRSREGHRMINEDNVKIEVYTCELSAKYCDECLALPVRFGCGWCTVTPAALTSLDSRAICTTRAQCLTKRTVPNPRDQPLTDETLGLSDKVQPRWLQSGNVCPDPQILSIHPLNATLTGRPVLHVQGINLGRSTADLVDHVQLDGPQPIACHIQLHAYFSSRSFTCQLDSAAHFTLPAHGRLKVVISKHNYQAFSPVFYFLAPRLYDVHPERGPIAGGTRLKLRGENLNIGANRTIWLTLASDKAVKQRFDLDGVPNGNISVPCRIESETPELVVCRTSALPPALIPTVTSAQISQLDSKRVHRRATMSLAQSFPDAYATQIDVTKPSPLVPMSLVLMHDLTSTFPIRPFTFIYSPNPRIEKVTRQNILASGGTTIRAEGDFLFVIESPQVLVYYNGSEYISPCTYVSRLLECPSPRLKSTAFSSAVGVEQETSAFVYSDRNRTSYNSETPVTTSIYMTHGEDLVHLRVDSTERRVVSSVQQLAAVPKYLKPSLLLSLTNRTTPQWPIDLVYGFIMDDVYELRAYGLIRVHPDPFVTPFPDGIRVEELDDVLIPVEPDLKSAEYQRVRYERFADAPINASEVNSAEVDREAGQKVPARVHQLLRLFGQFQSLVQAPELQAPDELIVRIGSSQRCLVSSVIDTEIRCDLDQSQLKTMEDYLVEVQFGRYLIYRPGHVRFISLGQTALHDHLVIILPAVAVFIVLIILIAFVIWRRFNRHKRDYQAKLGQKYAEHESRVVRVFREDFMELQTNMQEFSQEVKKHNLPYRDYRTFCLFSLFPEYHCELMVPVNPHAYRLHGACESDQPVQELRLNTGASGDWGPTVPPHPLLSPFTVPVESHDDASRGISLFHALICNRQFLCLCIRILEEDEHTTARDKSRIASLLCAALQPKMVYLTRIMCDLMADMLERLHSKGDNRLPTAFRRAESVVDKMVSNWLSFLLYNYIRNHVGENLFYFYRALLQQLNTGPRDAVTGKARYTLDSSTLLQTELIGKPINLLVMDPQCLFNLPSEHVTVRVLDCDTISQAKEKILDGIYKNRPYSLQLKPTQLDLKKLVKPEIPAGTSDLCSCERQVMCDWEIGIRSDTNNHENGKPPYRLNCIHDYNLVDNDRVALVLCEHSRVKSIPKTPASSRGLSTFRSQKSQLPSTLGGSSPRMVSPLSHESTMLSSEVTTMNGRLALSEASQVTSNIDDYASPQSMCSDSRETPFTATHPHRLPSVQALRPIGSPDPGLWYHLEWTGTGSGVTSNGNLNTSPRLISVRGRHAPKHTKTENTHLCCSHTVGCACLKDQNQIGFPGLETASPRVRTWTYRRHFTRRSPSIGPVEKAATGDGFVCRPLLDREMGTQDAFTSNLSTMRPNNSHSITKRRKRKRGKSNNGRLKLTQTSASIDRFMESLPKEVFFNRLVVTRLSVMKYMDKLFASIFSSVVQSQSLPSPIKYLFDFLDARAVRLGVQDPKIVHAWKSNCLQMRFWNQLITNLDYIFDIPLVRNTAFERSFHAFSQAMTYACAPTHEKVTSESSCVKVLFATDIQNQWARVQDYYREIKAMPEVKSEDMHELLQQHSINHTNEFNVSWAIFELYTKYVKPCHDTLVAQLNQEALKLPYSFKSDQALFSPDKGFPRDSFVHNTTDDFEFTDCNPMHMIRILNEVKQCMDQAQKCVTCSPPLHPQTATVTTHRTDTHYPPVTGNFPLPGCFTYGTPSHHQMMNNLSDQPGMTTAPHSSMLTTFNTTDYPDTLRSFNTLTTEFAADEASRITQQPHLPAVIQPYHHHHHHCYHVYETHSSPTDTHGFVHPPAESGCSTLPSPSTPVVGTRPVN